jgi:outer membrane immunogenic protein
MRTLVIATAIVSIVAVQGGRAADLPLKASPQPPPAFSWTGFYIGGNAGGGSSHDADSGYFLLGTGPQTLARTSDFSGGIAGGQVGFNYEFPSHWVIGIEGDGDWSGLQGSLNACTNAGGATRCGNINGSLNSFETVRGRLGYAIDTGTYAFPSVLLYASGGWAWGQSSGSTVETCLGAGCGAVAATFPGGTASYSQPGSGWTAGGGFEWAFFQHWSARFEYLHLQFNNAGVNYNLAVTPGAAGSFFTHFSSTNNVDVVRFGVNYLFN